MKKKIYWGIAILISIFGFMQFITPEKIPDSPAKNLNGVPPDINNLIRNSCYDCHSSQINLRWFDKLTPANFLVFSHIKEGRDALNFSNFDNLPKAKQNATLYYALNKVLSGEMPLPAYSFVHPQTKLSDTEIQLLKDYLAGRTPRKISDSTEITNTNESSQNPEDQETHSDIKASPNGIEYIDHWRNWTAISTTDRFDNGTMRIIYGNDIAVKAIQDRQINPFPDGAILAKAAWQQQMGRDSIALPDKFIQVEFMIKNAKKYASTAGWGWARWRGNDLKPYGNTATFSTECVSCHNPVKSNDYVFTPPLSLHLQKFLHDQ
jgi:hypothetical protein